jgi:hypothetical protein
MKLCVIQGRGFSIILDSNSFNPGYSLLAGKHYFEVGHQFVFSEDVGWIEERNPAQLNSSWVYQPILRA